VEAVAEAHEMATAIPSVRLYATAGPGSLHRILAAGLERKSARRGPQAVIYAAENDNAAASKLTVVVESALTAASPSAIHEWACFADTVIGKMSGVAPAGSGLAPIASGDRQAFLVEAFNRILISRVCLPALPGLPPFRRGIAIFEEKDDLHPFEEAKFYGHNAVHALAGYLGRHLGLTYMAELREQPGVIDFLRDAGVEETGPPLMERYAGRDPLFTRAGFTAYMDDLLVRMSNAHLQDTIARVTRDPARKLGWDDRLVGAIRLALDADVTPWRFATGAASALEALHAEAGDRFPLTQSTEETLRLLWADAHPPEAEALAVIRLIDQAAERLQTNNTTLSSLLSNPLRI
jgi:mannitol-1-phosphate 5-dehydrogenase